LTFTGISPSTGTTFGSNTVTLTGTGFTGATGVNFGGVAATAFSVVSDTQITCAAPAHAAGAVDVALVSPNLGAFGLATGYTWSSGYSQTGRFYGWKFQLGGTMRFIRAQVYMNPAGGGCNMRIGVYNATSADYSISSLVTCSNPRFLSGGGLGWYAFEFPSSFVLTAGWYFIGITRDTTNADALVTNGGGLIWQQTTGYTYASQPTDPFGGQSYVFNGTGSIYLQEGLAQPYVYADTPLQLDGLTNPTGKPVEKDLAIELSLPFPLKQDYGVDSGGPPMPSIALNPPTLPLLALGENGLIGAFPEATVITVTSDETTARVSVDRPMRYDGTFQPPPDTARISVGQPTVDPVTGKVVTIPVSSKVVSRNRFGGAFGFH
jgi:hypothetical protein